jgi:hypothetical protein
MIFLSCVWQVWVKTLRAVTWTGQAVLCMGHAAGYEPQTHVNTPCIKERRVDATAFGTSESVKQALFGCLSHRVVRPSASART